MGFRFHRSVKILPGVRLHFSKSGTSWSFGGHGVTVNLKKGRVTRTIGIPGTGMSWRSTVTPGHHLATPHAAPPALPPASPTERPAGQPHAGFAAVFVVLAIAAILAVWIVGSGR